jgi:hypothetical protein
VRVQPQDLFDRPSKTDTGARNHLDFYETPAWMTLSLLTHQPIVGTVFEPCAGDSAIARVLWKNGLEVITNDLDTRHLTALHGDASGPRLWSNSMLADVSWVITNPTFSQAFPILDQALQLARVGVAFLLRKTFLEPTAQRGPWFEVHPPDRIIGLPRHRFRGKGQDSCSVDWCIWFKHPEDFRILKPIVIDSHAKTRRPRDAI